MSETILPAEAIPEKAKIDRHIKPNRINFFKLSPPNFLGSIVVLQTTQLSTTTCSNDTQKSSPCQGERMLELNSSNWKLIIPEKKVLLRLCSVFR